MDNQNSNYIGAFITGAIAGALAVVLLDEKTRHRAEDKLKNARKTVEDKTLEKLTEAEDSIVRSQADRNEI